VDIIMAAAVDIIMAAAVDIIMAAMATMRHRPAGLGCTAVLCRGCTALTGGEVT
jgi:hypothetical protein